MVEDQGQPNWLDILLKGAPGPRPPALDSDRIKAIIGRALLTPRTMSPDEIREMAAAIIGHLQERKGERAESP